MLHVVPWLLALALSSPPFPLDSKVSAPARVEAPSAPDTGTRPRLVVFVVVDQLIPEQLDRLAPWLAGGLGRFHREGRSFAEAELGYARTETGPGHGTLSTGCYPSSHGVVGNEFFDRTTRTSVYCVGDATVAPVTSATSASSTGDTPPELGSVSPRNFRRPGLGDYLAEAFPGRRVVSIAGKDRAAVGLGGMEPDLALWWDRRAGGFQSSTYYLASLPAWVLAWNGTWAERCASFGSQWVPLGDDYPGSGTAGDDREGEMSGAFRRRTFPYALPVVSSGSDARELARAASAAYSSPLVDHFVLSLARAAVEELDLGGDGETDLLALGLSACDVTGHSFGPYSREVTDVLLRADAGLGELFEHLDERLGRSGWIACLSSDHGILDLPEALCARGVPARRVAGSEFVELRNRVLERFEETFGSKLGFDFLDGLVFDRNEIRERELDGPAVWELAATVARESQWIARALPFDELRATPIGRGEVADDPLRLLMARSVAEGRGPDVSLVRVPWTLPGYTTGTSHGSPYPYDRRIPLVFLGPGFAAGRRFDAAGAIDAAPTLLDALGLEVPPGMDGRALDRGE